MRTAESSLSRVEKTSEQEYEETCGLVNVDSCRDLDGETCLIKVSWWIGCRRSRNLCAQ